MNNETEVPELGYLICKNGMFYRPDSCGYTSAKSEAGRYSLNMAIDITHPNGPDGPRDGMTYIHETEVPDTREDLPDAKDARIAELEAELYAMTEDRNIISETSQQQFIRIFELEAKLDDCDPYLKDHETPAQRLESNHKEALSLLKLLEQEKRHSEAWVKAARVAEAKLAKAVDALDAMRRQFLPYSSEDTERWREEHEACELADATLAELKGTD